MIRAALEIPFLIRREGLHPEMVDRHERRGAGCIYTHRERSWRERAGNSHLFILLPRPSRRLRRAPPCRLDSRFSLRGADRDQPSQANRRRRDGRRYWSVGETRAARRIDTSATFGEDRQIGIWPGRTKRQRPLATVESQVALVCWCECVFRITAPCDERSLRLVPSFAAPPLLLCTYTQQSSSETHSESSCTTSG